MKQHQSGQLSKPLSALLMGVADVSAANDCDIHGLAIDSREVKSGDLFFACRGAYHDGTNYVKEAIAAGAVAVVVEHDADISTVDQIPVIPVLQVQQQLGIIAARFYADPSQQLFVAGVTGTNGKTSCCHFIAQALQLKGKKCGVIGTLGYGIAGDLQPATHTTPNPLVLQSQLKAICEAGAEEVVMEVSSHALEQGRVAGVSFDAALFTNLTRDHLDYHGDFAAYGAAKQKLFTMPGLRYAVINRDDPFAVQLLESLALNVKAVVYGLVDGMQDLEAVDDPGVYGQITTLDEHGIEMRIITPAGEGTLRSKYLLGEFNARNLLAVLALLLLMDIPLPEALALLAQVKNADGRMERLGGKGVQPLVVIDYAHTPDALQNVLSALRHHCRGRLWCLFGCGGERDKGKRPLMGEVAVQNADVVIITDDNPRSEDGAAIVHDITASISPADIQSGKVSVIQDRAAAIKHAVSSTTTGDVVVIAGKGHEQYQLVAGEKIPFSDRDCVAVALREVA